MDNNKTFFPHLHLGSCVWSTWERKGTSPLRAFLENFHEVGATGLCRPPGLLRHHSGGVKERGTGEDLWALNKESTVQVSRHCPGAGQQESQAAHRRH